MNQTVDTGADRQLHRRPPRATAATAATGGIALAALAVLLVGVAQVVAAQGLPSSTAGTTAATSQDVVGPHDEPVTHRAEAQDAPAQGAQAAPEHGDAGVPLSLSSADPLARINRDVACVALTTSLLPGSISYLTCLYRPDDGLVLVADPLIDGNVDLLPIAASANDSRSLSLTGGALAFGGTCIVGFTPLGTADSQSSSDPDGTSSTTRGNGILPVTLVELAYVSVPVPTEPRGSVPTESGERPTAGAAVGVAVTPDGQARSSGTVTRDGADSEREGLGGDVAVHSEDVLGDTDEPSLGTAVSPDS